MKKSNEVEDCWNEFWKDICTHSDGTIDLEAIKKELFDFHFVIQQVPKVYSHITGGQFSKVNYYAEDVILEADNYANQCWEEYLKEEKELWNEETKKS